MKKQKHEIKPHHEGEKHGFEVFDPIGRLVAHFADEASAQKHVKELEHQPHEEHEEHK